MQADAQPGGAPRGGYRDAAKARGKRRAQIAIGDWERVLGAPPKEDVSAPVYVSSTRSGGGIEYSDEQYSARGRGRGWDAGGAMCALRSARHRE